MTEALKRKVAQPARYLRLIPKLALQTVTPLFRRTAFRLEGQMDINPLSRWHDAAFANQWGGFQLPGDESRRIVDIDPWDSVRRDMLVLLLRDVIERKVPGEMAELGVYRGQTAKLIHSYVPERPLHLYDTFLGFDARDLAYEATVNNRDTPVSTFADTSIEAVLQYIASTNGRVHLHQGVFPFSVPASEFHSRYCFVHLDADLYAPTLAGLKYFYPRMESGGFILVHDFNAWPGARKAVRDFCSGTPESPIPMPDKSGSALIQKR
jgi:O-methyltransferase